MSGSENPRVQLRYRRVPVSPVPLLVAVDLAVTVVPVVEQFVLGYRALVVDVHVGVALLHPDAVPIDAPLGEARDSLRRLLPRSGGPDDDGLVVGILLVHLLNHLLVGFLGFVLDVTALASRERVVEVHRDPLSLLCHSASGYHGPTQGAREARAGSAPSTAGG
jgi:hypothetical protein